MPVWLTGLLGLLLPVWFWLSQYMGWPFWLAGLLLLPLVWLRRDTVPSWLGWVAAALGLCALGIRSDWPVKLYPVLVNLGFLLVFAWSLTSSQTVVERIARLTEPDLPQIAVRYTRKVTIAWCVFFSINGLIALLTVFMSNQAWALYNGLIAYILMGIMFAAEYLIRCRVRSVGHGH